MTVTVPIPGDLRSEAARLAFALIRFSQVPAHPGRGGTPPGVPRIGTDAYVFTPSSRRIPASDVESFLVGLPSPAILLPTTGRGAIALHLLHELTGDRRRSAEKGFSNAAAAFDEVAGPGLELSPSSRILVEFDDESHIFSYAAVRECFLQFAVSVGWNIAPLTDDPSADACLKLVRSDFKPFSGRSCMLPPHFRPRDQDGGQ